jgi:ATP-dependent DNA ligase
VLFADFVEGRGLALFRAACERDLEGIVAKQKDAPYSDGVHWVKIKNPQYGQATGRQEQFQHRRPR